MLDKKEKSHVLINPFDFENLIQPLSKGKFFEEYWEKKPLVLTQRGVNGYEGLPSIKDFEQLITNLPSPEIVPWLRVVNNKKELPIKDYLIESSSPSCSTYSIDREKMLEGFYNGNTIILNILERRSESIARLSSLLENIFGGPCGGNLYLTPSNAQGFQPHYDSHDVFILQIEGEKNWKIYSEFVSFPTKGKITPFLEPLGDPIYEECLQPGDLLYIPRGWVHEAFTAQNYSLHLTAGIHVFTWIDFFSEVLKELPELKRALPVDMLSQDDAISYLNRHLDQLEYLKQACCEPDVLAKAFHGVKRSFAERKSKPFHFGLVEASNLKKIDEETLFKKREGIIPIIKTEYLKTSITIGSRELSGPAYIEPVLERMMDCPVFSAKTLPDHLSCSGKLDLIRSLVKTGFLEFV